MNNPPRLTIGVLTVNEERRIAACLASAAFADEIIVVDSGSTDRTVEIARAAGATVHVHADWQGFAVQRNRLLEVAHGDWIFFLDADEEITPALRAEIEAVVAADTPGVWEVQWEQVAFGRRLSRMKSTGGIPRLFLRSTILRFDGVVHEGAVLEPAGLPVHRLHARMPHYSRESIHGSILKLAQYSQNGAAKRLAQGKRGGVWRGIGSAFGNFVRLYFLQRGFLCGGAGFLHCFFVALECFFRYAALKYDRHLLGAPQKRSS
ncbi:MAG: glycosyltransferase family 2 protein [Burkholderiaceae bacterium]|nr:glycosyltransferase family 2 protein [Burkholderiaceae bacterium]